MSYRSISDLTEDMDLRKRINACAILEQVEQPWGWVDVNMWKLATQPGWGDAYASAQVAYEDPNNQEKVPPGRNEGAITDSMILSAVQAIRAEEAATQPSQEGQ